MLGSAKEALAGADEQPFEHQGGLRAQVLAADTHALGAGGEVVAADVPADLL